MKIDSQKIYTLYVALSLFGYCFIGGLSSLLYGENDSATLTILFRALIAVMAVYYGIYNLFTLNLTSNLYRKLVLFLFVLFWSIYGLNGFYDYITYPKLFPNGMFFSYYSFGYFVTVSFCFSLFRNHSVETLTQIFLYSFKILLFGLVIIFLIGTNDILSSDSLTVRVSTSRVNSISLGKYSASLFIISYCLIQKNMRNKYIYLFGMILGLTGIIVSGSRTALVGILSILFLVLLSKLSFRTMLSLAIALLTSFFAISNIMSMLFPEFDVVGNYLRMGGDSDQSANIRFQLYNGAWAQFVEHPLFGDVSVERNMLYSPHNFILEILMSLGVIGILLSTIFFALVYIKAYRLNQNSQSVEISCLLLLAIFYFVGSMFSGSIVTIVEIWSISIIFLFLSAPKKEKTKYNFIG